MFNLFKKKSSAKTLTLQLSGLHCLSCSLNIDSELEDLLGVKSSTTSYAKQQTSIIYDPAQVDPSQFRTTIESLGYKVTNN